MTYFLLQNTKEDILENVGVQSTLKIDRQNMASLFCVPQGKEGHTDLEQMRVSK